VITADILVVLRYREKKTYASSFLVPTMFGAQFVFHLYFWQSLPSLQRGLSATDDLLVLIPVIFIVLLSN